MLELVKALAFVNDFLLAPAATVDVPVRRAWARRVCDRHAGIGADGLILYTPTPTGARMTLLNADGSDSEVSGNGVRCLAALLIEDGPGGRGTAAPSVGRRLVVETDAGPKPVTLLGRTGGRLTFEAEMGSPQALRRTSLDIAGERLDLVTLRVGNPQCVALMALPDRARFLALGEELSRHPAFSEGTNVELAEVVAADRVRILIWERGVGPTRASGTGACAAAVAAAAYGGADREMEVEAPGGTQRVVWHEDGLRLTGWAELVWSGRWLGETPDVR